MYCYVVKTKTCPRCGGGGIIQHPAWERYHRERPTSEDYTWWWQAEGYDPRRIPPEEIECPDCDGRGRIEVRVPALKELAAELFPET